MAVKNDKEVNTNINDYKKEIDEYIKEKINKGININEYKSEIEKYARERVEKEAASDRVRFYKKQLRDKNIIVFILFILLLISLSGIVYGVYYLYNDGYFDKNKIENKEEIKKPENNINQVEEKKEEIEKENRFQELKDKYSYLLDNINIDVKCNYINDFYSGNLSIELKEYIAYKALNKESIINDDTSSYFDVDDLGNSYSKLFNDKLVYKTFKYNGITYKYLDSKKMFISNELSTDSTNIEKEITSINEEDGKIIISTVEGYFKDKKLYNVKTNKEVSEYKDGDKMSQYKKKLTTVSYVFNNGYLESIK